MGVKEHPLYKRWRFIVDITTNENDPNYKSYAGGHGIENHFNNFDEFCKYIMSRLGPPKPPFIQLHRKNQSDHFRPGNLVWATNKQVGRNQRNNARAIERLKANWSFEEAMEIKPRQRKKVK